MIATTSRSSIDWLTMTRAWQNGRAKQTAEDTMKLLGTFGAGVTDARPFPRNYEDAIGSELMTASWHDDHPNMRVCFNMTGHQCQENYLSNGSVGDIVRLAWENMINFTRIDFAIDYFGEASIGELVSAIEENPDVTIAQQITPYRQINLAGGRAASYDSGCYIGSQKSARYLCVYDKALEQGLPDKRWVRIELRNRKEKAGQMAEMIVKSGVTKAGVSLIKNHTYPAVDWWQDALQGDAIEVPPIGRKETDTVRWLVEVVAPVLMAELGQVTSFDDPLYQTYKPIVDRATSRLVSERVAARRVDTKK